MNLTRVPVKFELKPLARVEFFANSNDVGKGSWNTQPVFERNLQLEYRRSVATLDDLPPAGRMASRRCGSIPSIKVQLRLEPLFDFGELGRYVRGFSRIVFEIEKLPSGLGINVRNREFFQVISRVIVAARTFVVQIFPTSLSNRQRQAHRLMNRKITNRFFLGWIRQETRQVETILGRVIGQTLL